MPGRATKSTPISPPALVALKPIRVSTLVRWAAGSRSRIGCRRCWGSSAIASAASSARIRASTAAISSFVRAPSRRVARSSSSSSNTSASSSGSACTRPRISVSSSLEASSSRSAIWAGFSLRMRANGLRSSALPSCPMSHSKSCQSRKAPASSGVRRAAQPEQPPRAAPGIHPGQHPLVAVLGQLEVGGADQARVRHVDEPVTEHVGPEQHLAVPALEVPQVKPRARQPHRIAVDSAHLVEGHEDLAPAHGGHQAGDERVVSPAEPHDDVVQPPDRLAAAVRNRPLEQLGQAQRDLVVRRGAGPGGCRGWWCRHGKPLLVRTVTSSPASLVIISMPSGASAPRLNAR